MMACVYAAVHLGKMHAYPVRQPQEVLVALGDHQNPGADRHRILHCCQHADNSAQVFVWLPSTMLFPAQPPLLLESAAIRFEQRGVLAGWNQAAYGRFTE